MKSFSSSILILIFLFISIPIFFGVLGTLLPSFGYFLNNSVGFSLKLFLRIFELPGINKSIFLTTFVGITATFISLLISQIILIKLFDTRYYNYLIKLITPLIAFPHITMAVGLSFLFASSGFFVRIFSFFFGNYERPPNLSLFPDDYGIFLILGLVLKETPFFLLMSINILLQFPSKKYFDVGKLLRNDQMSSWFFFVFPQIYKKLKISIIIVLVFSSSVLDMSYILSPTTPSTLSIRILELYQTPDLENISLAAALSIFQLILIFGLIIIWYLFEKLSIQQFLYQFYMSIFSKKFLFSDDKLYYLSVITFLISIMCIIVSILWSISNFWKFPNLLPTEYTINNFIGFAQNLSESFFNTIYIGVFVSILSFILILCWLELTIQKNIKKTYLEFIFFIPILIPELSFLLGINFFLLQNNYLSNFVQLIWIEVLYIIPYTYLILEPAYRGINEKYIQIGKMFGKSNLKIIFSIKLPLIFKSVLLALGIGFLVSIGLYTPVYFVGQNEISTLSIELINFSFSGNRKDLGVVTILQMFLPLLTLSIVYILGKIFVIWKY